MADAEGSCRLSGFAREIRRQWSLILILTWSGGDGLRSWAGLWSAELCPRRRKADIQPLGLRVARPRRHARGLSPVDPTRGRHDALMLSGPLQLGGDRLQHVAGAVQHAVDDLDRRQRAALVAVAAHA